MTKERLLDPWEILWAPDGHLWATERSARGIIRIDPTTGVKTTLVTIADSFRDDSQDGVLGLALHPSFLKNRGAKRNVTLAPPLDAANNFQAAPDEVVFSEKATPALMGANGKPISRFE